MKLVIVRQRYTPFGGAERFVERALASLRARGIDVTVIAREWTGGADAGFLCCNPFSVGRTWRDASFARGVQRIIASGRFDLVQSHERIPGCHVYRAGDGVHATWLDLRRRIQSPLAAALTRLQPWHRLTLRREAAMFAHPALRAVICNSQMVKDDIVARFGLPAERLHVIRNGVNLDDFHPGLRAQHRQTVRARLGIPPDAPVVLFVGSGYARKGLPQLIAALAQLPAVHLIAVGKDRNAAALAAQLRQAGRQQTIHLLGGQADVRPFYGAADIFALPTLYDPFPNAALEALACGLPLLTTPTSGAAELVEPSFGAVVDALDVPRQAQAIEALLALDPLTAATAARAAASRCSIASATDQLLALYDRLGAAGPV